MPTYRFAMSARRTVNDPPIDALGYVVQNEAKHVSILADSPEEATEKATSLLGPLVGGAYWAFETHAIIEQDPEPEPIPADEVGLPPVYNVKFEFGHSSATLMRSIRDSISQIANQIGRLGR